MLALIVVHLLKKYEILQDVDSLLVSLWKLFHYSPIKQQVLKICKPVFTVWIFWKLKVFVMRWLSGGFACKKVIRYYQQLVETLDILFLNRKEPELKDSREQLISADVLLCLLFLSDFLKIINQGYGYKIL